MITRVVYFGSGNFGLATLDTLRRRQIIEVVAVVSQPDRLQGRKMTPAPTPTSMWANTNDLPLFRPVSLKNNEALAQQILNLKAELALVADFGMILPANWLKMFPRGGVNLHASILPKYRGASPIQSAIINGDRHSGISFMLMDAGIDTGSVLATFPIPLSPVVTAPELYDALASLAAEHAPDVIQSWLHGQLKEHPQPIDGVTLTKKICREDGHAQWDKAETICRQIRAYNPWPGVWTTWKGSPLKILQADFLTTNTSAVTGTVAWIKPELTWGIACRDGWLRPQQIQFSGRRPQAATEIPGSYPDWIGAQLI